ncbi:MAG: divalent-cation tolerance protein CutA [Spirochaetes bacterium]|nr:divalent-cation tolerance protein CutA [Spirochaetota bacterium]
MVIADDLISGQYAACVNIVPGLTSIYRWKGEIARDIEMLLIIKSRRALFGTIRDRILSIHPHEVPEIISMDISDGNDPYLKWISDSTRAQ